LTILAFGILDVQAFGQTTSGPQTQNTNFFDVIIQFLKNLFQIIPPANTPINNASPVFAPASNVYILAIHTEQGYAYGQQSAKTGQGTISGIIINPTIHIPKGTLVALHVINEDKDTGSDQDLNIDAFNVHTRHLKYFESQTINFIADKQGAFPFYSTIHPEMKGSVIVDP